MYIFAPNSSAGNLCSSSRAESTIFDLGEKIVSAVLINTGCRFIQKVAIKD